MLITSINSELSENERTEIRNLSAAVYPADAVAEWPGRKLEWAKPDYSVRIFTESKQLVFYTGVLTREINIDGAPAKTGGIGGVMTHPDFRRHGYASKGIQAAINFCKDQCCDLVLLVCEKHLINYYSKLGWRIFAGEVFARQFEKKELFTFNQLMYYSLTKSIESSPSIDLCGPPW